MKILIAPDKFKGSLTAAQAAEAIARGWRAVWPECEVEFAAIADGGEGFAAALCQGLGGEWISAPAHDALGREIEARYAWIGSRGAGFLPGGTAGVSPTSHSHAQPAGSIAVIEMSEASGLWRLRADERDPLRAHTLGTGELVRHAAERGASVIYVGLGGSATTDGGAGLAAALGYSFLNGAGDLLTPEPANFPSLARIDGKGVRPLPRVIAACDVENPLLGARGTARVFSAQKGATLQTQDFLEGAITHLADVVQRDLGCDFRETPGAGAAGGLGYGLLTFAGATVRSGFEIVAEVLQLPRRIRECDLIITGEGRLDRQTLEGKGPAGVAALAREARKPVLAFGGSIEDEPAVAQIFDAVCPIVAAPMSRAEAMSRASELLEAAARRAAALLRAGATLPLATSAPRDES